MKFPKMLLATVLVASSASAMAADVNLQRMFGPNGEAVTSATNFFSMSKNGRFMMFRNHFGDFQSDDRLWVQDIKTGEIEALTTASVGDGGRFGISESGQYVAYYQGGNLWVLDRVTGQINLVEADFNVSDIRRPYVSNKGDVVYFSNNSIRRYTANGTVTALVTDGFLFNISANAEKIVYSKFGTNASGFDVVSAYVLDVATGQSEIVSEDVTNGRTNNFDVRGAAISSNGKFVAIAYPAPAPPTALLEVVNLETGAVTKLVESDLHIESISGFTAYHGLSVSDDGRYVSAQAQLMEAHPDYAAVVEANSNVFNRIFRIDTVTPEALVVSRTHDGSPNASFVNVGNFISRDGRHIGFAANAKNLLPGTPISAEEPYHAHATTFAANYMFVGMPNSDQGWKHFSNMSLVADNTWEGTLYFDGQGQDAFKFDVGGAYDGLDYISSADWSENYGVNGQLNGPDIVITEGKGEYRITFNDVTKQSTITKVSDMVYVTFTCNLGHTYLGQSVYVVGNINELGSWSVEDALKLDPTDYPTWSGTFLVPASPDIEWKCVKREEDNPGVGIEWQSGSNNVLDSTAVSETTGSF